MTAAGVTATKAQTHIFNTSHMCRQSTGHCVALGDTENRIKRHQAGTDRDTHRVYKTMVAPHQMKRQRRVIWGPCYREWVRTKTTTKTTTSECMDVLTAPR